jgi:hypothetical protein
MVVSSITCFKVVEKCVPFLHEHILVLNLMWLHASKKQHAVNDVALLKSDGDRSLKC